MDLTEKIVVAAEQGAIDQVKEALKEGASPDAMGPNSGALHVAAAGGHLDIVKLLLDAGANPNRADQQSFYPLHLAASACAHEICSLLLAAKATVDVTTNKGGTPLHVAAATGCSTVLQVLLKQGANLEAKDSYDATPLLVAAAEGEHKAVQLLLEAGAAVKVLDKNKENALLKATRRLLQSRVAKWKQEGEKEGKPVQYTLVKGAFRYKVASDNPTSLGQLLTLEEQYHAATQAWGPRQHLPYINALATISTLLETDIDVHAPNVVGHTPMWMACSAGESKIIRALQNAGANFDGVEDNGSFVGATCLHKLAASGRLDGLEVFFELENKYAINGQDGYGWTPLHYFADMGGHRKIGELLLLKGANKKAASTKDRGNGTPLGVLPYQVALHWKDQEAANLLKP